MKLLANKQTNKQTNLCLIWQEVLNVGLQAEYEHSYLTSNMTVLEEEKICEFPRKVLNASCDHSILCSVCALAVDVFSPSFTEYCELLK